ncbi:hypothetical protein EDD15DRAFT_1531929 [Pisolithus albus]|nr:hypothetical protein EDD15DRAFT_1531929 [Pisolithus albus]
MFGRHPLPSIRSENTPGGFQAFPGCSRWLYGNTGFCVLIKRTFTIRNPPAGYRSRFEGVEKGRTSCMRMQAVCLYLSSITLCSRFHSSTSTGVPDSHRSVSGVIWRRFWRPSFVVIGLTSLLSPKPTRACLCTPIPQTSSGGASQVRVARSLAAAKTLRTPHWGPLAYFLSPRTRSVV